MDVQFLLAGCRWQHVRDLLCRLSSFFLFPLGSEVIPARSPSACRSVQSASRVPHIAADCKKNQSCVKNLVTLDLSIASALSHTRRGVPRWSVRPAVTSSFKEFACLESLCLVDWRVLKQRLAVQTAVCRRRAAVRNRLSLCGCLVSLSLSLSVVSFTVSFTLNIFGIKKKKRFAQKFLCLCV